MVASKWRSRAMTLWFCLVVLVHGCGGHGPLIPRIERALTAAERNQIDTLADMIDEAGPMWAEHSHTVRVLLAAGRIGVGRLPKGKDSWATWHPRQSNIILAPSFWQLQNTGQAGLLVIEACHVRCACEDACDGQMFLWVRDYQLLTGDR